MRLLTLCLALWLLLFNRLKARKAARDIRQKAAA